MEMLCWLGLSGAGESRLRSLPALFVAELERVRLLAEVDQDEAGQHSALRALRAHGDRRVGDVILTVTTGGGAVVPGRAELCAAGTSTTAETAARAKRRAFTGSSVARVRGSPTGTKRPVAAAVVAAGLALRLRSARRSRHLAAPERRPRRHARRCRLGHRRRQRRPARSALALRSDRRTDVLGRLRLDAGRRPHHGLRAGPPEQRLRPRPLDRERRAGCTATARRTTGRTGWPSSPAGLRRDRLGRIRALGGDRAELWRRHLTSATEQFVDVAPVVWRGLVFTSTVGYPPGGRGAIYALDAATGAVRWKFDTIEQPWRTRSRRGAADSGTRSRWTHGAGSTPATRTRTLGRHAEAAERRRVPRPRPVHRLADRARRAHRPAALARPGHPARRPRLRLRGDTDPRDGRGAPARLRGRQGRPGDRLGPRARGAGAGPPSSDCTATTWARCRDSA